MLCAFLLVGAAGYGAPPPQAAAPSYGYGGAHHHTNVIVTQARPIENRVFVEIKPSNYVVLSIITMLFFCWIFGLIGLIVGMQVRKLSIYTIVSC